MDRGILVYPEVLEHPVLLQDLGVPGVRILPSGLGVLRYPAGLSLHAGPGREILMNKLDIMSNVDKIFLKNSTNNHFFL